MTATIIYTDGRTLPHASSVAVRMGTVAESSYVGGSYS
jgi:hypothetical protein